MFLKVSPIKGVMRFGVCSKLSPRYVDPFEILKRIRVVAYYLALLPSLVEVHNIVHISMLRKYVHDPSHMMEFGLLQLRKDLSYVEQPVRMMD